MNCVRAIEGICGPRWYSSHFDTQVSESIPLIQLWRKGGASPNAVRIAEAVGDASPSCDRRERLQKVRVSGATEGAQRRNFRGLCNRETHRPVTYAGVEGVATNLVTIWQQFGFLHGVEYPGNNWVVTQLSASIHCTWVQSSFQY
jgi:hypothetical protein